MLKLKTIAPLACVSLGCLFGLPAQASCVTEAMTAIPYFDMTKGELVMPLIELSATPSGEAQFLATRLQYQSASNPAHFAITQPLTNPNDDCEYISIPVANFNMSLWQLSIPTVALISGGDEVAFYSAKFQLQDGGLTLLPDSLIPTEGRYSGVVYNQATQQPLKNANVSLDGVEAAQPTNSAGHFTITGIGNSVCQTLTISSEGFAPMVKEVDIRYGGLKACETMVRGNRS